MSVDYVGLDKILWATDYPHPDGFFSGASAKVRALVGNAQAAVMAGGAKGFHGLN